MASYILPTLRQFLEKILTIEGVTWGSVILRGPRGKTEIKYVQKDNGPPVILPNLEDGDIVNLVTITSLCRQLGISVKEFNIPKQLQNNPLRPLWDID